MAAGLCVFLSALALSAPPDTAVARFHETYPGVKLATRSERVVRVWGRPFSRGADPVASAEAFRHAHADVLGANAGDLVLGRVQPIRHRPETGTFGFTGVFYRQQRGGVPVFGAELKLVVRNDPAAGFPLVLASSSLRDLSGLRLDTLGAADEAGRAAALARASARSPVQADAHVHSSRRVIWAGVDDAVPVRPALETIVEVGPDAWLVLTDSTTGEVLHEARQVHDVDVVGSVHGVVTEGAGAAQCAGEATVPLPDLLVTSIESAYTDADGSFVILQSGTNPIPVTASLEGLWFEVSDFAGDHATETVVVTPPGPAALLFNAANDDPRVRAQVDGYVHAGRARAWIESINPAFPGLDTVRLPVIVNRTDFTCPGNAWYSAVGNSINFCLGSGVIANSALPSLIAHEYGHHVTLSAHSGGGAGAYGEGMADAIAAFMHDDPVIGRGLYGSCLTQLRSVANLCVYDPEGCSSCGPSNHLCGLVLAGTLWDLRNELARTDPDGALALAADLAVSSILLHTGSLIEPEIRLDFLTLDDDDGDICNGTPNDAAINAAFDRHGLVAEYLDFQLPEGAPEIVDPAGTTTVPFVVTGCLYQPAPGTGLLHHDVGDGFVTTPMFEESPNRYLAQIPPSACGSTVRFYFSVETASGVRLTYPGDAPDDRYEAVSGIDRRFADDFEANQGWTVTWSNNTNGRWERVTPLGSCLWSATRDADGSGMCYVTGWQCADYVFTNTMRLTSPRMDATGETFIGYWRWFGNFIATSLPNNDSLLVQVSDDDGVVWVPLEAVGPEGPEAAGGWRHRIFRVADFVEPNDQFRIRFVVGDSHPFRNMEAAVDGVELFASECACPIFDCNGNGIFDGCDIADGAPDANGNAIPDDCECLGDLDGDGTVDSSDLAELIAAWGPIPGGHLQDIDADRLVSTSDLLILLAYWGPCP